MLVRDYHFNLDEDKIFTYAKGRIPTRILNPLSLLFPRGERFFIESVRKFENQITDEQLRKDIKNMCLAVKELIEQTITNYRILAKLEQQEKKK